MKTFLLLTILLTSIFYIKPVFGQNDSVPNVVITTGTFEKIIVVRIKTDFDILEGLKKAVRDEKIKNAVILTGIGSIKQYNIHSVKTTSFPTENIFATEKSPFDILNVNGYIINGRVHAHITLSDLKKTIGGHLEPGTIVYTFGIITIGILSENTNLEDYDNWRWR